MQSLWKTDWQFLKMLNTELPQDPAIPPLGIYPREMKTHARTKTCMSTFTAVLFIISKKREQLKCPPVSKWINKMW